MAGGIRIASTSVFSEICASHSTGKSVAARRTAETPKLSARPLRQRFRSLDIDLGPYPAHDHVTQEEGAREHHHADGRGESEEAVGEALEERVVVRRLRHRARSAPCHDEDEGKRLHALD